MSKKNKETEALLEEEAQNESIQTLAGDPDTDTGTAYDSDDDSTTGETTPSDSNDDDTSSTTDIPSNFNLSYFWNHYGYIEQNSFTSYIQQLEGDTDDSGSNDGGDTAGKDTEPGTEG